ncbi:hypothetical protein TWF106_007611 [Orbilia oligospora]|uniref:Uncharacterized protein n=1 Tax=Orbilia oligospora TaxID=2813651 RepID=A0A7C8QN23_ORBOL|nr:hypothetical protein TWF106_007611 [Orbilia oligospora]
MTDLFKTVYHFMEAMENWYPFPSRTVLLYPNRCKPGNPNFAPVIPPNPIARLCINETTAWSLIVAVEEYQAIMWRVRPTAWPSMPHDERQISDIIFHMTGLLQTMRSIIPDHLHEIPGPLKETMDCLAQSLIRLESINPDIRGQWQTFNDVSSHTSSNTYQEILDLTNMKLRQLRDKAIGDTFPSPVEDKEAESAAAMIIESTTLRQENIKTDSTGKQSPKIWGILINFNVFRRRKETTSDPSSGLQTSPEQLTPSSPAVAPIPIIQPISPTPMSPIPTPSSVAPSWWPRLESRGGSDTDSGPPSTLSFVAVRAPPLNIPGIPYRILDTPVGSPVTAPPYSPVSKNATVAPIPIGTPSSSPTHVAIREAAEGYRRKKAAEFQLKPEGRRKPISQSRMARAAARRAAMGFHSNLNPDPISGVIVGEALHIENVGRQAPRPRTPKPPPRVQTTRPRSSRARHARVRVVQARPTGGDDENVPRALALAGPPASPALQSQPSFTRADFAKQMIPKTGVTPVSLLSIRA